MSLKSFVLIAFIAISSIACQTTAKLKFDTIKYYSGNNSLPPEYREMLEISIDSSGGSLIRTKGDNVENGGFEIGTKEQAALKAAAHKLPLKKAKLQYADGAAVTSIELYTGDSLVYTQSWQPQHKIAKQLTALEKQILSAALPTAPKEKPEEQNKGGE